MAPANSEVIFAPGTVGLTNTNGINEDDSTESRIERYPIPSNDPNDPLNWSSLRKSVNFTLVCFYLDIATVAYGEYVEDLHLTYTIYTISGALNYVGLAIGCIILIPFVHRYGRRPLYLFSSVIQLASSIWAARVTSPGGIIVTSVISGIGGAISETIVQITIADIFVHQRATMNGIFLAMQSAGAYLGPVAAGFIVQSQGWRWMWWWCAIFLGINLVLVAFFFEESKYIAVLVDQNVATANLDEEQEKTDNKADIEKSNPNPSINISPRIDLSIKPKPYRERLALFTKTPATISHHFYQPFIALVTFPAVAYSAITYGSLFAWFSVITSVESAYLIYPPYNFGPAGIGLLGIAPFVGSLLGSVTGAPLSDRSIMWLSRRNGGIFEPEMRLYMAIPAAFISFAVLAIGWGIYGFGFMVAGDVALSYVTDCYQNIVADALVAIVFVRNAISVIILFTLSPWISSLGIQNTLICASFLALGILLIPIPLLIWGKRARIATAEKYRYYMSRQPVNRLI
ncbi:major facilitator superfamily transporter [Xylogone sp. PMI_703]|nr:major facilitator superfamily transporter [Xylogone sp. PMI_703]